MKVAPLRASLALGPLLVVLVSCAGGDERQATATPAPTAGTPSGRWRFTDITRDAGLAGFTQRNGSPAKAHIVETVGGGVALFDFDRDGILDVYLTNGSALEGFAPGSEPRDAFYRGLGQGRYEDRTRAAGLGDPSWTQGITVVDFDADGWSDIFLTSFGRDILYRNRGDGGFEDVTLSSGLSDQDWSTGAAFLDYDDDGDLDVYVANYVDFDPDFKPSDPSLCTWRGVMVFYGPKGLKSAPDRFYENRGDGTFRDRTSEVGIRDGCCFGFQAVAYDYDDDRDVDVYVANDSTPNFLWQNQGDGTFREVGAEAGVALSDKGREQGSMGVALGDHDGDGRLDLHVTNFAEDSNTLYRNDGGGFFTDVTSVVGLVAPTYPSLGWATAILDFDGDGDNDLLAVNGHVYPAVEQLGLGQYRQRNQLFENPGDGRYREVTAEAGPGFADRRSGRGAAFGDIDADGDLDLLLGNLDEPPTLLRHDGAHGHWLVIELTGVRSPRDPIGALITVEAGGRRQIAPYPSATGFLSSSPRGIYFGFGPHAKVDRVSVRWPSGASEVVSGVAVDRTIAITEGRGVTANASVAP